MQTRIRPHLTRASTILASILVLTLFNPLRTGAQPRDGREELKFNISIEDGLLLTAPLKEYVDVNALWGKGNIESVPATVENLARFLRAADTNLNLVLSPEAGRVIIRNLKLRSAGMPEVAQAVSFATDGVVAGRPFSDDSPRNWTWLASRSRQSQRTVEVFNLRGFIDRLGSTNNQAIQERVIEIQQIILETLEELDSGGPDRPRPEFRFHRGTDLLIVIGDAITTEVTRKVVEALPGQSGPAKQDRLDSRAAAKEN